jgi:tRNA A-37 threonylcarbamoyl transferase component Bud32
VAHRAWLGRGVDLAALTGADGDFDRLLTRADCTLVKFQRKVIVGRIDTAIGPLYVKRYNVYGPRHALAGLAAPSPAARGWAGAEALAARGFEAPEVVAAVEFRRFGLRARSFLVTRAVAGVPTADERWREILALSDAQRRRVARRALARTLGELFRRLHAAGVYHRDLKDVNILVTGPADAPRCVLLDLEQVRVPGEVGEGRRRKNVVQLERTLGRLAAATDRARFLRAYLGPDADRETRRGWARAVLRAARRKDRRHRPPAEPALPTVSATVVCQDEGALISRCLETVAWCDEIVVVDGGSRDDTVARARAFSARVIANPWPGYRAQKQFALDQARGEWVLNVDADERVTPELMSEIRRVLARVPPGVDAFAPPRLVSYLGRWWWRGGWYPRRVARLLRRRATVWGGIDPHERALVRGRVVPLNQPLIHHTYADIADHLRSANRLTTIAAVEGRGRIQVGIGRMVMEPVWRFVRAYAFHLGVLEGVPGLFVAATGAFYAFLRVAKVWEAAVAAPLTDEEASPRTLSPPLGGAP